jgi:hypothetical protein
MAPQAGLGLGGASMGSSGSAGMLPSLGGGGSASTPTAATPTAGADPTAVGGGAQAASGASWLSPLMTFGGPLATAGGGFAAYKGIQSGNKWLKLGGIAAAIGGITLTALGFKAKGAAETEQRALLVMQQMQQQSQAQMQQFVDETTAQVQAYQQQTAAGAGAGAGAATGSGQPFEGLGVGPGLDTTTVPGGTAAPIGEGSTPAAQPQTTGATGSGSGVGTPAGTGATTGAGSASGTSGQPWSIQSVVGTTVDLAAGASSGGVPIADAGSYRIEQVAGDQGGYATLDEANAAVRQSMSTELMGSKFLRWMVVEHGGRFYGVIGKQLGEGQQQNPMGAQHGSVVAWSAMNHVSENGISGWKAYSWSQASGAQSIDVAYGTSNVFGGVSGGGSIGAQPAGVGTAPSGTLPTGTAPTAGQQAGGDRIDQAIGAVTGGGPGAPFDPATQIGRTFAINASTTAEGDLARGGSLQLQRFVESSAGGFGTAEEAAVAARAARSAAGGGTQWSRWLTLQGGDGRYYVYEGSIVARATKELEAAPVHVFGAGFAEYFDGSTAAWKAVREQQVA